MLVREQAVFKLHPKAIGRPDLVLIEDLERDRTVPSVRQAGRFDLYLLVRQTSAWREVFDE